MSPDKHGDPAEFNNPQLDVDAPAPPAGESFGDKVNRFARKFAIILVAIGLAVITYFILANFLPQWWAQRIANRVEGKFSSGIWSGLTLGFICTLLPIVFVALAVVNRKKLKNIPSLGFVLLAVITAIPNLLTLSIVVGRTSGAYRGQNILDISAPGFRGAGLWGTIIAVIVGVIVCYYIWRFRRRGRDLRKAKATNAELSAAQQDSDENP
ncbi:hypothetical protein [Gordonia sp. CPCC 205333]|uniref:hypothetical protein n=1 Tax=Gordonia sp. CPCC 205333 TaxID=3140790 RepID=UPI003AF35540